MKRIIVIFSLIVSMFMITGPVQAAPYIDLIASSCSTYGFLFEGPGSSYSWNESGATSAHATLPGGFEIASVTADVEESTASISLHVGSALAHTDGTGEASISFLPIGASYMKISMNLDTIHANSFIVINGPGISIELENNSPQSAIINGNDLTELYRIDWDRIGFQDLVFPVDSSQIYSVHMWGQESYESVDTEVQLSLLPVPEPTTMLLLSLGLIGLAGVRRKFKK